MQWHLKSSVIPQTPEEFQSVLLANRGVTLESDFFNPKHPFEITLEDVGIDRAHVTKARARLKQALETQEDILVFGDYDADGICSTAVLWLTLHHLGYNARPFIPHREKHGYGLNHRALDEILAGQKPSLVITVDNGIVAVDAVKRLAEEGIDVIITDHHQPDSELPPALAIVHTTQLCGTTVAWMLAKELDGEFVKTLLDFGGIATIADQVPLKTANRSFAHWGIEALKTSDRVGLLELYKVAELKPEELSANSINYGLAPRINAMGRLDHGLDALRLLCTSNQERARQLVETLQTTNIRRQGLTSDMVDQAQREAHLWVDEHIIIAYSPDFHEGVIGLIAGKLMEEFYKPAIVISVGEKVAKASARSIPGVNIVELIREVRDELLEVGGHPMAAGFGLLPEKIESVKNRLQILAKEQIAPEQLVPAVNVECVLPFSLVTQDLVEIIQKFQPFGQGNHEPVIGLKNLQVLDAMEMGRDGKHLKMVVTADDLKPLNCLAWNQGALAHSLIEAGSVDIAGCIEINEWKGRISVQLKVKDVVAS